jgi:WS/DGAT/MGAT family acyltransferase
MSATDALFWYTEAGLPRFRPIIAGLYVLGGCPRPEEMDAALQSAVVAVPRLQQRVVEPPLHVGMPEWVDDPHFDFEYHVRRLAIPSPGNERDLLDLCGALLATPLDRERPLWELYWIDGIVRGRSALFLKLHHSLVDGVGSLAILDGLTGKSEPGSLDRKREGMPHNGPATGLSSLARLIAVSARTTARLAMTGATLPLRMLAHPGEVTLGAVSLARRIVGVLGDAGKPRVADPLVRPGSGLSRRLDTFSVSLARLRAIKAPLGVTVNDVVLTALTGCLGAYYRERRVSMSSLNCMVPINLRSSHEARTLGNRVGFCNVVLPIAERDLEKRLRGVVRQTTSAKRDHRGTLYPVLVEALAVLPGAAVGWLARKSLGRINVVCTNVPGLSRARSVAGVPIEAMYPFASVVEGTPLVMALLSYAGVVNIGIDTDPEAIPNPHRISELFDRALDELEKLARDRAYRRGQSEARPANGNYEDPETRQRSRVSPGH